MRTEYTMLSTSFSAPSKENAGKRLVPPALPSPPVHLEAKPKEKIHSSSAELCMVRARSSLVLDHPFFGSLALGLRFQEDPSCKDLWTDGKVLGYNPAFVSTLSEDTLIGAQAHELLHLVCGHHIRRNGRDEPLWNKACDYAVNHLLLEAGFRLPQGALHDPVYAERSVDDIFLALLRLEEELHAGAHDVRASAPKEVNAEAESESQGNAGLGGEAEMAVSAKSSDSEKSDSESGRKLSAAGQGRRSKKSDAAIAPVTQQPDFSGEVRDHPLADGKGSRHSRDLAEQESHISLSQALQRALHMGDMPVGLARLVKEIVQPVLDWRGLLLRFLENTSGGDYSWTVPNRRYVHQNLYLPSLHEPRIPELVLAVDSSGSVDEEGLAVFCAELSSILDAYDTKLTVLFHDTAVHKVQSFARQDRPFTLAPAGGGGTDYRPVCEYIEAQYMNPVALLWFTDLQCTRFPEEPAYPVLWVVRGDTQVPPFGEMISLPRAY